MRKLALALIFICWSGFSTEYSISRDPASGKALAIIRASDGASIPIDTLNRDFKLFQEWNAAQPVPLSLGDDATLKQIADDAKAAAAQKSADDLAAAKTSWANLKKNLPDLVNVLKVLFSNEKIKQLEQ